MERESWLAPTETIIWRGRPSGGLLFKTSDIFVVPFTFLWAGFAWIWLALVLSSALTEPIDAPLDQGRPPLYGMAIFIIIGSVFSLVGLYISVGRFIADMMRRAGTRYYLTGRRAVIVANFFGKSEAFMPLTPNLPVTIKRGKRGSIVFGPNRSIAESFFSVFNFFCSVAVELRV